jgi:hypothetical protein
MKIFWQILLISFVMACKKDVPIVKTVEWLDTLIAKGSDSNGKIISVYTYNFKNAKVYLVNYEIHCCDYFTSQLFSENGNSLCYPYGGVGGKGDQKCLEFDLGKSNEKLYWVKPK